MSGEALQKALYQRLTDALADLNCPVYDDVPEGSALPYVQFASSEEMAAIDLDGLTSPQFIYLSVWSDYAGQLEVKRIMQRIKEAIRDPLTLEKGRAFGLTWVRGRSVPEPDGKTYQGLVALSCFTE
ncbi:DUF3168 domain-containing protein [Pseudomonas oryzihabitans]|uniref:DUF3168 domain-containing protein n=1 Tax=Pseudomonas oryzihabitans TaxID=47885 RepID=UPI0028977583|nr:DUF3168 domain-containing protein [Pseudomonas oryzihabitans]